MSPYKIDDRVVVTFRNQAGDYGRRGAVTYVDPETDDHSFRSYVSVRLDGDNEDSHFFQGDLRRETIADTMEAGRRYCVAYQIRTMRPTEVDVQCRQVVADCVGLDLNGGVVVLRGSDTNYFPIESQLLLKVAEVADHIPLHDEVPFYPEGRSESAWTEPKEAVR